MHRNLQINLGTIVSTYKYKGKRRPELRFLIIKHVYIPRQKVVPTYYNDALNLYLYIPVDIIGNVTFIPLQRSCAVKIFYITNVLLLYIRTPRTYTYNIYTECITVGYDKFNNFCIINILLFFKINFTVFALQQNNIQIFFLFFEQQTLNFVYQVYLH